ncbi:MAG: hypothetical protein NTZ86_07695, partial [Legionellales bacterium]|nr:hypothetical protein [Legionellales bacterium]
MPTQKKPVKKAVAKKVIKKVCDAKRKYLVDYTKRDMTLSHPVFFYYTPSHPLSILVATCPNSSTQSKQLILNTRPCAIRNIL